MQPHVEHASGSPVGPTLTVLRLNRIGEACSDLSVADRIAFLDKFVEQQEDNKMPDEEMVYLKAVQELPEIEDID